MSDRHAVLDSPVLRRVFCLLLQAEQLPPQLAAVHISYKDFKAMAALRSSIYSLSFALDFCTQVRRCHSRDCCECRSSTSGSSCSAATAWLPRCSVW